MLHRQYCILRGLGDNPIEVLLSLDTSVSVLRLVMLHLSFGKEVQKVVSMASISTTPRKIGKENILYICNTIVGLFMV